MRSRRLFLATCLCLTATATVSAQSQPKAQPAQAELEVVADSAGQPIFVNGLRVGVTPATVRVTPASAARIEVGNGARRRVVTMDLIADSRARLDVVMARDTQPLSPVRSRAQIEREIDAAGRFSGPPAPVRPVLPTRPGLRKSVVGGLLIGASAFALGSALCEQTFNSPAPAGGYVNGTYYPPGKHSLGVSGSCVGGLYAGTAVLGSVGLHQLRRVRYERARRGFGARETQYAVDELAYRGRVTQLGEARQEAIAAAERDDRARRNSAIARNDLTLRSNRELPRVTFITSQGARVEGARTSMLPPDLRIVSLAFEDADGDSAITAGERGVVRMTLENQGRGTAYEVRVTSPITLGVRSQPVSVGTLSPGERREVSWPVTAADDVTDGQVAIELQAVEANGFDAAPYRISIPTLSYRPPELVVADVGVRDPEGNAIIKPGVLVTLIVRVQNRGGGPAENVELRLERGDTNVFFAEDRRMSASPRTIGRMRAGEHRDVEFEVMANTRAKGFPFTASVTEGSGRYSAAPRDLGLTLQTPMRAVSEMRVERAVSSSAPPAAVGGLGSDLMLRVPVARELNPDAIAVIIGNRDYRGDTPDVLYALNDAEAMRIYAERTLGIRAGNIIVLRDATLSDMKRVFGDEGTKGTLGLRVKPGQSDVFVFYSGHGAPDPRERTAYLMPVDADANSLPLTGLAVDKVYESLARLNARHVTVVLDACFSGSTGSGEMLVTNASPIGIVVRDPSAMLGGEDRATVVTASTGQELANWYPEMQHGMLTYFFLKGLQGGADSNGDSVVSVREMREYLTNSTDGLRYEANVMGRAQTPQVWGADNGRVRPPASVVTPR